MTAIVSRSTAHGKTASKVVHRAPRVSTSEKRAKTIKTVTAKKGQDTVYGTLKKVWSARGEILVQVKGTMLELKKADIIRVLKNLPREDKSPYRIVENGSQIVLH